MSVKNSLFSQISLSLLLVFTSVLVIAQLRTQRHLRVATYDGDEQAVLLSELVEANRRLREEVELLTKQKAAYKERGRGPIMEELVTELNRVRVLNGMIEVSGPGVEITIDGPLSALDLQDLVNEVRNAGAEAVGLNEQCLVVSSVFEMGQAGEIELHGQPVQRPYRLQAIGDKDVLEAALARPGGLLSLLQRTNTNLVVRVVPVSRLVLGVNRSQAALQYAQPLD